MIEDVTLTLTDEIYQVNQGKKLLGFVEYNRFIDRWTVRACESLGHATVTVLAPSKEDACESLLEYLRLGGMLEA